MSERRFWIKEVTIPVRKTTSWWKHAITESELKRRIQMLANNFVMEDLGPVPFESIGDAEINILLNGDGDDLTPRRDEEGNIIGFGKEVDKGEEPHPIDMTEAENKKWADYQQKMDQPSPAPTREEWEKWVSSMSPRLTGTAIYEQVKAWFLSMPIIPKE